MAKRRQRTRLLGLTFAVILLSVTVTAARGDSGHSPRCALLDLSKSPVAALVEAKLLAQPDATWLERTELDKVLAEQELSALLVAAALKRRVALGRVLKADILVLLETREEHKQQFVRLVVAEAAGGLRLISTKIPLTGQADSDAQRIVQLVRKAIDKRGEEITEVFTVPPFYSRDLTYEFDDLKRTYATLIQQRLLTHPGVLVVELDEADAIAREYALASPGDGPTRRLPLYLLGEYRNEGVGDQRRIALTMRLKRGDKTLRTTENTVSPDAAADFLLQTAGELAGRREDREIGSNTQMEARQLAQRGAEFLKLGDWDEALALSQASLLLRPDQPDVHAQARRAAAELAISHLGPKDVESALRGLAYRRLALRHLDAVARSNPELDRFYWSVWQTLPMHRISYRLWEFAQVPDEITKAYALLEAEERAFLVKLAHRYARAKSWNLSGRILDMAQTGMAPIDRYAQRRQFIIEYQDEASPATLLRYIGRAKYSDFPNSIEARQFLEDIASASEATPDLRKAARATVRHLDQKRAALSNQAAKPLSEQPARTAATPPSGLQFRPLPVTWRDTKGGERKLTRIHGCLPIPGCADVLWNHQAGIYLMRRKGEAELVWPEERIQNTNIRSVVYDGKYVWFTTRTHRQIPQVWVLEPVTGRKWQLTVDHGLPLILPGQSNSNAFITPSVLAAPIAPGKAMLAGSFGRAWLATIEFQPDGDHQVQIFHEARKVEDQYDFNAWKDPEVAFGASYLLTLTSGDRGTSQFEQRIMVGRGAARLSSHPLIVNPETLSIDVRKEYWYKRPGSDLWQGNLYFTLGIPPRCETLALWRCTASDLTPKILIRGVKEGIVIMQDDAVNIVGEQWWRGTLADSKLKCLGDVPWHYKSRLAASAPMEIRPGQPTDLRLEAIGRSHHYGLLASFDRSEDSVEPTLAQVLFDVSHGGGQQLADTKTPSAESQPSPPVPVPSVDDVWGYLARVTVVALSHNKERFATADVTGRMLIWSADGPRPVRELPRQAGGLKYMDFSYDDQLLASAGADATVCLWNVHTGDEILKVSPPDDSLHKVLFAPDGRRFVTVSSGRVRWWDIETARHTQIETMKYAVGFLPDGTLLGQSRGIPAQLIAWNPADQSCRLVWQRSWGRPAALSPDGRRLLTVEAQGFVDGRFRDVYRRRIWDLRSQQEIDRTELHRPLTFYRVDMSDKLAVTSYFATEQRWRFQPAAED